MNYFVPHGYCLRWNVPLLLMYVLSNWVTFGSYLAVPYAIWKTGSHIPLSRMIKGFIVLCGFGHLIQTLLIWFPIYWFSAYWDTAVAIVSVATAIYWIKNLSHFAVFTNYRTELGDLRIEHERLKQKQEDIHPSLADVVYGPEGGPDAGSA